MMNSENKFSIKISFKQMIDDLHLTLVDATFDVVYSGVSQQINLELFQGIYQLKARFIDYYQEYLLVIDNNREFSFDFNYPSGAPILSFKTTREYFSGNCSHYSLNSTIDGSTIQPNFLLFGAKYDKDLFAEVISGNNLLDFSILNDNNVLLFKLNADNSKFDNDYGWFAFSHKLENGLYFLKWNNNLSTRIFPFYIYDNYQTQFFIRYSQKPDFENAFFFYSSRMEFKKEAKEYLVLDKILYAYRDYKNYALLTGQDFKIIQEHPFLVSLVHILQLLLNTENLDFLNCEKLLLPDLILVDDAYKNSISRDLMPVISSVMSKYAVRKKNDTLTFRPASIIDRTIDHLKFDIFWNNFSKIDDVNDWSDIYTAILQKSKSLTINNDDSKVTKFGKVLFNLVGGSANDETIKARFNALVGKINTEDIESTTNDIINSIGDVSEIASKLNLPPTKVLRNYKAYKDIFDKLT